MTWTAMSEDEYPWWGLLEFGLTKGGRAYPRNPYPPGVMVDLRPRIARTFNITIRWEAQR